MHQLSMFEKGSGLVVLFLATVFIVLLIAAGFNVAYDAKDKERERSFNRRVERLAKRLVRERLDGCRLQVIQRISIIEDDLKGGRT